MVFITHELHTNCLNDTQLNMERESGKVFSGWNEGKISFAPTYKYSHNSDSYTGETVKSKKKRRTPAWYDKTFRNPLFITIIRLIWVIERKSVMQTRSVYHSELVMDVHGSQV